MYFKERNKATNVATNFYNANLHSTAPLGNQYVQ